MCPWGSFLLKGLKWPLPLFNLGNAAFMHQSIWTGAQRKRWCFWVWFIYGFLLVWSSSSCLLRLRWWFVRSVLGGKKRSGILHLPNLESESWVSDAFDSITTNLIKCNNLPWSTNTRTVVKRAHRCLQNSCGKQGMALSTNTFASRCVFHAVWWLMRKLCRGVSAQITVEFDKTFYSKDILKRPSHTPPPPPLTVWPPASGEGQRGSIKYKTGFWTVCS